MDPYSMVYGVASGAALYLLPWLGVIVAMLFIQGYGLQESDTFL